MKRLHVYAVAAHSVQGDCWYLVPDSFSHERLGAELCIKRYRRNMKHGGMTNQKIRVVRLLEDRKTETK